MDISLILSNALSFLIGWSPLEIAGLIILVKQYRMIKTRLERVDKVLTDPDELRTLFLFEKLTDEQLEWLGARGSVREYPAGATVLSEGDPAEFFLILLSGTISMSATVLVPVRRSI